MSESAFGIDHGDFSKAFGGNIKHMGNLRPLGQFNAANGGNLVGAGSKTRSGMLGVGRSGNTGDYKPAKAAAKRQGKLAGQQLKWGEGTSNTSRATRNANAGWGMAGTAKNAIRQPAKPAPAGMRGSVSSRIKPKGAFN